MLVLTMLFSLTGCSSEPAEVYRLGQTVSTDIVEITLLDAQLAIALENTTDDSFYLPKKYNAGEDAANPQEMTLDVALDRFSKEDGKAYFAQHLYEFAPVDSSE